jgi:hypothetical protein
VPAGAVPAFRERLVEGLVKHASDRGAGQEPGAGDGVERALWDVRARLDRPARPVPELDERSRDPRPERRVRVRSPKAHCKADPRQRTRDAVQLAPGCPGGIRGRHDLPAGAVPALGHRRRGRGQLEPPREYRVADGHARIRRRAVDGAQVSRVRASDVRCRRHRPSGRCGGGGEQQRRGGEDQPKRSKRHLPRRSYASGQYRSSATSALSGARL